MFKRAVICVFNIIFPPVAVGMLTGFGSPDTFLNSVLFLCAIIPSHIHGFYISMIYFNRKRRVRKGQYPGGDKTFIYSEKVTTGGAGYKEARRLKRERGRVEEKEDDFSRVSSRKSSRSSRRRPIPITPVSNQITPVSSHRTSRYSPPPTSPISRHSRNYPMSNRTSDTSQLSPIDVRRWSEGVSRV